MFGHHVAVLYNKIELEFAVGGIGEAPFLKVVCSNRHFPCTSRALWKGASLRCFEFHAKVSYGSS